MSEDNSGIFEEIRAERQELEEMLKVFQNVSKEEIILSATPFLSLEEKEGKLIIAGIALAEGVWKNVVYPAEELEKAATKLKNKPLKVEHGLNEEFKDRNVGVVTNAYYDKTLRSIIFQAEVTDPEAIKNVKEGVFPAVSCSTWVDKFPLNATQNIGFNYEFNELSLVKNPSCEKCFIFAIEELSRKINKEKEDLNIQSNKINQGVKIDMSEVEEWEEIIDELDEEEEEEELSEIEEPKLYAVVEAESLSDFEEELAKKIVSYYYGYPYPYGKKYPYPHYPYYPYYPYYGFPKKGVKRKRPEKKSLWALLELKSPSEIEELRKKKKVVAVYYGYYGYPYPHYPFIRKKKVAYYPYPYYPAPYSAYPYSAYPYYPYPYYPYYPYHPFKVKKAKITKSEEEQKTQEEELLDVLELAEDYKTFMKKCMRESKTMPVIERMKECAKAFKTQKLKKKAEECPEGQIWDEKEQKCVPIEKKEAYPVPEQKTSREWTDFKPGRMKLPEGPAEEALKIASKEKLSETVKKEEASSIPEVTPMQETKPCEECPKKEEEQAPETKEKVSTETNEEPKAETPKVEEKKIEEEKTVTEEEVREFVKQHYPELILKLRQEKKFP